MTSNTIRGGLAVVALMPFSALANGPNCVGSLDGNFDGRFYEVVVYGSEADKDWDGARTAAEALTHDGIQGQLATINSPEEDGYLYCLVNGTEGAREAWVGGFQEACDTEDPEPGCGWQWINGEPIAPTNTSPPFTTSNPYTHWQDGEPNDDTAPSGNEMHLAINLGGDFGWNDEGRLGNIGSYVVEYGDRRAAVPLEACAEGCNPTGGQIIQFPPQAVIGEGDYVARTWRFNDDAGRCGISALSLDLEGDDGMPEVIIPAYLCGHPDFLVIKTEGDVEIPYGVVEIINQTATLLPDNLYGCNDPITGDPTEQDVVTWQTTDKDEMLETALGEGQYEGTLAEVTHGCGTSRGSGGKGSWFVVGLRIQPGPLHDLQKYKLTLLRAAVVESRPALRKIDWLALRALVDAAIFYHNRGMYEAALFKVRLFMHLVERINYTALPGENYNGEHTWRARNLEDMYSRRIIPFAP